jgi:mannosyltransferase
MLLPARTGSAAAAPRDVLRRAQSPSPELILLVAVVVIGATLRLASITAQSLWVDEATTAHEMHLSLGALLHAVRVDETTPPLYFLLAWVWAKVFGSGELGLRLFSACLGIALIPLAYGCARELVSRRAGVVAAALVAVNPFMIWYSQEARSYALFAVFSAASFLFCARAWRDPTSRNLGWWAAFSALAVLTHFFAGFLILPEALLLVVRVGRAQRRGLILAFAVIAAAQAAVLPLALSDTSHPLGWIKIFPLSVRIQQVPVDFGLGALYQSPIVTHGLLGAAVLAAIVLALLAAGGGRAERRGARFAAVVAAVTLLVPVILAALGRDYLVPRNLMAAWIPLAVVLGAACTVPRARIAGAGLAIVLLVAFVIAGVRIAQNPQYQRPNWRGVAAALGDAAGPRAIVAYDGGFAAQPLAVYMPGIPWTSRPDQVVAVSEVDVVGSTWQSTTRPLPSGTSLISKRTVDGFLVERFSITPGWRLALSEIARRAGTLLGPAPANPAVLVQRPSA